MNLRRCGSSLALLLIVALAAESQTAVVGYYPSWTWRERGEQAKPAYIPFDKLTLIDYAFFYPLPSGRVVGRDSAGDRMILEGKDSGGTVTGPRLADLAHAHGVKVVLSVGGWADSYTFPPIAATEATRERFAQSCNEAIDRYGFDGIDIDWEYPCFPDHNGTPEDKGNFTLLLRTIRDSLDAHSRITGQRYLLSAAVPASGTLLANFELDSVMPLLDMLNIMTYDFCGNWDSLSGYNAPLYAPDAIDTLRNVDAAFRLFTVDLHVPAAKINIGVPFYGHSFSGCTGIGQRFTGADTVDFPSGNSSFYAIDSLSGRFDRRWDAKSEVPYLVDTARHIFISYDDPASIALKAQYAVGHKAAGIAIWEITGDRTATGATPLLDAIAKVVRR